MGPARRAATRLGVAGELPVGRAETISVAQARRAALAAQGFLDPRPKGPVTRRHLARVLGRLGVLQIDSVNVLARAHYLPLFSRLGAYPTSLLDRAAQRPPRMVVEYWAHMASYVPVESHPLFRWRMDRADQEAWGSMRRVAVEQPELVAWVREQVAQRGPVTAAELERDSPRLVRGEEWGWNWSDVKSALEWLFYVGEVASAGRTTSFARRYDLPERVLPRSVVEAPTPARADAIRELVRISARALGVAAEPELRDYFRLPARDCRRAVAELVEEGTLRPVTVADWRGRAYLHAEARLPRRVDVATLVSPFDPLVWERGRTHRLFDFHYRIGIYTVAQEREYGYYALPFLMGDTLVARVDLKADRQAGVLLVPGVWAEPGTVAGEVAARLAPALVEVAQWLGLGAVGAAQSGDLAGELTAALVREGAVPGGRAGVTVIG